MKTPCIITVADYHEFNYIVNLLMKFGEKVFYKEINETYSGRYMAIFYRKNEKEKANKLYKELNSKME